MTTAKIKSIRKGNLAGDAPINHLAIETDAISALPVRREKVRNNTCYFSLLLLFVFLLSCNKAEVYYHYRHIDKGRWYSDSVIQFQIDAAALTQGMPYDLSIEISTNGRYPYRDIWMQVTHNLVDTIPQSEALHFRVADDYGHWLGDGVGGLYQLSLPLHLSIPLDTTFGYVVQLRQIMDANPLPGIEKIGLKVEMSDKRERGGS
ncbi:MAG: gliding motility lipoprotein GldH [Proteiniphilum sp.]|nr:gliding motility lipoprotein GldH [Proteiniphilum sp.]MDD3955869.1 gliding motility lipoprotein GldH [Proteiniphilum sp.]